MTLVASVGIAGMPGVAAASPLYVVPGNSLQVPAGGTAYLQVRGIALQPGANIPSDPLTLAAQQRPAGDRIRTTLYYGIDWGYADTAPQQVALAIWWAQDGTWRGTDHATAERIASAAANSSGIPSWNPDGRNLLSVISQNQGSVSALTLTSLQQTPSVGSGTLTVRNTSGSDMTVYLPYGTLFTGASGSVLVWATGVGGAPPQATATGQAAGQPTATATAAPATQAPATSTQVPVVPTMVSSKGGGVPPPAQQPTDTPPPTVESKGVNPTPTDAPVPPTDTPVPPTDTPTPQPTDTPRPTDTPLPPNTATSVPQQISNGGTAGQQSVPQLPPSQPEKPVQQKGNGKTTQSNVPAAPQSVPSGSSQSPAQAPSQLPGEGSTQSTDAPLPLTAEPTHSPTPSGAGTSSGEAAPPPVGTTLAGPPSPVSTAAAKATVPFPVITVYPTAVVPNSQPTKQAETPPVAETAAAPGGTTDGTANTGNTDAKPPEQPTPAPTPVPAPVAPGEPPVIVVTPPGTNDGSSPSGAGGNIAPNGGDTSPAGGQTGAPKENPVTGAGPTTMPLWLAGAALMMLLGGWTLRRSGRAALAHRTEE